MSYTLTPTTTAPAVAPVRRGAALAVLCAAVFIINVDSTIVNIALPALVRQLGASTRDLQWVVDAYNLTAPRWDPQQLSPALCKYSGAAVVMDVTSLDPWFQQTDYIGAVPYRLADPSQDWTTGWTYYNRSGGLGRTDINYAKPLVILTGPQTTMTLSAVNNYLLRGKVNWVAGATLTVPAGTYLFGERAYFVLSLVAKSLLAWQVFAGTLAG